MKIDYRLETGETVFNGKGVRITPERLRLEHDKVRDVYFISGCHRFNFECSDYDTARRVYWVLRGLSSHDFVQVIPGVGRIVNCDYQKPHMRNYDILPISIEPDADDSFTNYLNPRGR